MVKSMDSCVTGMGWVLVGLGVCFTLYIMAFEEVEWIAGTCSVLGADLLDVPCPDLDQYTGTCLTLSVISMADGINFDKPSSKESKQVPVYSCANEGVQSCLAKHDLNSHKIDCWRATGDLGSPHGSVLLFDPAVQVNDLDDQPLAKSYTLHKTAAGQVLTGQVAKGATGWFIAANMILFTPCCVALGSLMLRTAITGKAASFAKSARCDIPPSDVKFVVDKEH